MPDTQPEDIDRVFSAGAVLSETLLHEINVLKLTQMQVAETYALALREINNVDWPAVNQAIINRWSKSGLKHIKEWAWAIAEKEVSA